MKQPACTAPFVHGRAASLLVVVMAMLCMYPPLHGQQWHKFVINSDMIAPVVPRTADLDGDGDQDVIVSDWTAGAVYWYENTGDLTRWTRHVIDDRKTSYMGVGAGDFNGDGRLDVAAASYFTPALSWYENPLPLEIWERDVIIDKEDGADGSSWLEVGDIDGDGDNDILMTAGVSDNLRWFENAGGNPIMWMEHQVKEGAGIGGGQIRLRDMDQDGDLDIVAAINNNGKVVWLESLRGGRSWIEHPIDRYLPEARTISVGDFDDNGKLDVVAGGARGQAVVRYEQVGYGGNSWIKRIVDSTLDVPGLVEFLEIDGRPSKEIVATSYNEGIVVWYREVAGIWHREIIDGNLKSARGLCIGDVDGDGNRELIVAAQEGSGSLVVYRNDARLPRIAYSPSVVDFGKAAVDSTVTAMFEIMNTGKGILDIRSLEILGYASATFGIDETGPFRLGPGETMSRELRCTPREKGVSKKVLRIRSSDPSRSELYVNLVVEGVTTPEPRIRCTPIALDFGDVKIGCTKSMTLDVANIGSGTLLIETPEIHGTAPIPFRIEAPEPLRLDPRRSTTLKVFCTPTGLGKHGDTLTMRSNDPDDPIVHVPMSVNGVTGLDPRISLPLTTLYFGLVRVDSSVDRTLEITNTGDATLLVGEMGILGIQPCPFCLSATAPLEIVPGETREITITCRPTEAGTIWRPLEICTNDPTCNKQYVNLKADAFTDIDSEHPIPTFLSLEQNYPNPFNPSTTIRYTLPNPAQLSLVVTDILGREVGRLLDNEFTEAGTHRARFDAGGLPSGMYFYTLVAGERRQTRKMLMLR